MPRDATFPQAIRNSYLIQQFCSLRIIFDLTNGILSQVMLNIFSSSAEKVRPLINVELIFWVYKLGIKHMSQIAMHMSTAEEMLSSSSSSRFLTKTTESSNFNVIFIVNKLNQNSNISRHIIPLTFCHSPYAPSECRLLQRSTETTFVICW